MRITRKQLRRIIKEELNRLTEDPDGIVPGDVVSQAAAQSAARQASQIAHNDVMYLISFLDQLDEEQMHYTEQRFMDSAFEEWLRSEYENLRDKGPATGYGSNVLGLIHAIDNSWSGYRDNPATPFPEAGPNVAGQKFAGFARVNSDVFSSENWKKVDALAKFFKDHRRDPDLT